MVKITIHDKVPKNAVLFEGFQGIGVVGVLAAEYLAEKLKAKQIGFIEDPNFPPIATLVAGEIRHPVRILHFKHKGRDFLILVSELPIPNKIVYELADAICNWARRVGIKEIISLEGIVDRNPDPEPNVYALANHRKMWDKLLKYVDGISNGIVVGISAILLLKAKAANIPAGLLLAEANPSIPDGKAAAAIINVLNRMYGFKVDVKELKEETEKYEKRIMEQLERAKMFQEAIERKEKTYIG